jgi:hypothetical protein
MNWAETMQRNAHVAPGGHATRPRGTDLRAQREAWSPYEIWLTRIKQPRDSAARTSAWTSDV